MFRNFDDMPASSRVWIYQSEREMSKDVMDKVAAKCQGFCENWEAHGKPLESSYQIIHNQFIVITVNEQANMATGCSIDKSVSLMREIEQQFGLSLFDRTQVAFLEDDRVFISPMGSLKSKVADGVITRNTVTFNNLVKNLGEFRNNWLEPAGNTWLKRYFA